MNHCTHSEALVAGIREILAGIDTTETESSEGWWETSDGAEFGRSKLDELVEFVRLREFLCAHVTTS